MKAILLSLLTIPLMSSAAAIVELHEARNPNPWVGQAVRFSIDLGVEGLFAGAPVFDIPEQSGLVIVQISTRPTLSSRTVSNQTLTIQSYDFALFGRQAGELQVAPILVRFASRSASGQAVNDYELHTSPWSITLQAPPDRGSEPWILSSPNVRIKESWAPLPEEKANEGDAFVWTLEIEAENYTSMLIPEFRRPPVSGMSYYAEKAILRDQNDRGNFTATRIEKVTYVCETGGSYTLPGVQIRWWNTQKQRWESKDLPSFSVKVKGSPRSGSPPAPPWVVLSVLAGIILTVLSQLPHLRQIISYRKQKRHDSERAHFQRLLKSCARSNAADAYRNWQRWNQILPQNTDAQPLDLPIQLENLQQAIIKNAAWQGSDFANVCKSLRRNMKTVQKTRARSHLPPLNPQ